MRSGCHMNCFMVVLMHAFQPFPAPVQMALLVCKQGSNQAAYVIPVTWYPITVVPAYSLLLRIRAQCLGLPLQ